MMKSLYTNNGKGSRLLKGIVGFLIVAAVLMTGGCSPLRC